jgi:hypothetical protein
MSKPAAAAAAAAAAVSENKHEKDELLLAFAESDYKILADRYGFLYQWILNSFPDAPYIQRPLEIFKNMVIQANAADKVELMQQMVLLVGQAVPSFWSQLSQSCHAWRIAALRTELDTTLIVVLDNSTKAPPHLRGVRNYMAHLRTLIYIGASDPTHEYSKALIAPPGSPMILDVGAAAAAKNTKKKNKSIPS